LDPQESVEDRLESALAKQYGEAEETPEPAEQTPDDSPEESADSNPEEHAEDDSEEVEYEGTAYKVPKVLKDALLRQSDYTRKTQEVAKQRQQAEELTQALTQQRQFHEAAFDVAAEAKALESQIKRYDGLDWAQLAESDPTEYLKLDRAFRALKDQHAAKAQEARQKYAQAQQETAKQRQTQAAKAHEELSRDIQGWGPEIQAKLGESGRSFGFTDQELANLIDPRMVKVLHAAHQWKQLQSAKPGLQKKVQAAKPVTAPSARTANSSHRATQYSDARQKLKKSGSNDDAIKALELRFASKVK